MNGRGQWGIEGIFVATEVVTIRKHPRANGRQIAGLYTSGDRMLTVKLHLDIDRSDLCPDHVLEKVTGHRLCEGLESLALCRSRALIKNEHRLCRIWIAVRIAESGGCPGNADDAQAVEFDPVPTALLHTPGENRLVADQSDL